MSPNIIMSRHIIPRPPRAAGHTLVELLVALATALFLIAGLGAMLQSTGHTSHNQLALAQLQNDQRTALDLLTDAVQQAGYYNTTGSGTLQSAFPAVPGLPSAPAFTQPGQFLNGQTNATANGDSITLRYQTDATGTVLSCPGDTQASAAQPHEYTFSVNDSRQLVCAVDANAPVPLANNVQHLQVLYGIDATASADYSGTQANAYAPANQMTQTHWTHISSVKVTLTFVNPLASQPGQQATPPITFSRVISVMGRTGVNVVTEL